jgi:hypothetical protein
MSLREAFSFDPRLTLDGIMTLSAGVIAFVAVVLQIRSTRKQIELQLEAEKKARALEFERQKQVVARALLFEIVNFYRYYCGHLRPLSDQVDVDECAPPLLSAPNSDFFGVYRGSASHLGAFEPKIVEKVVKSCGLSAWLLSSIRDYTRSMDQELERQPNIMPGSAPRKLLKQIKNLMYETDAVAVDAMQELCKVADVPFDSLKFTG